MKTLTFFNNKGGVGKTTLSVNVADALVDQGLRILMVDADPQCNLTSFFLEEKDLDALLGESDDINGGTIWSSIKPVVDGKGGIKEIEPFKVRDDLYICPGDVLLADYEEELPAAFTGSFARKARDYDVMCALSRAVRAMGERYEVDIIIYDVGPNLGPLNRAIILDSDFFITPVAADLFSLRALTTVGRGVARWIADWKTVRNIADAPARETLLNGMPVYLRYVTSAYKVSSGRTSTKPHEFWEAKIAPRVRSRVVEVLRALDPNTIPPGPHKLASIKDFHSLAPQAQEYGLAIGKLRGFVNSGYNDQVAEANVEFHDLAKAIKKKWGYEIPRNLRGMYISL